jgi:hypothetical protein
MPILNSAQNLVIYDDTGASNNPQQRYVDWRKPIVNVLVDSPLNEKFVGTPGSTTTLFSGTRATSIDGTSQFSIALNSANSSIYRIANTAGTAPVFRTDRGLTLNGSTITVAINNNATATFSTSVGTYGSTVVGDVVFVPTVLTGDSASPFNILNGGYWTVIGKANTILTLTRPAGVAFSGVAEAVVLSANSQLQAFSSAGIQVGDTLEISAGFSLVTQKSFRVSSVTPSFVEFFSTIPLPLETGILPTASGMTFYSAAKRFVRIEVDQEAAIRFNGDTNSFVRLSPRAPGDLRSGFAHLELWGTIWSISVVNRSTNNNINIVLISAQ